MRRFLLAFLAVVCLSCLATAVACGEPEYYTLTYISVDGAEIECEIPYGYEVKNGVNVEFTLKVDEDVITTPIVYANNTALTPDSDGVYTFKMTEDTNITVSNVRTQGNYNVTFDRGDYINAVFYSADDFDPYEGVSVKSGETISFSVGISVYCGDSDYTVLANSVILEPDSDGVYTATITANTTITVSGVTEDEGFFDREDGGKGTKADPYRISKPIDLYYMAVLINSAYTQSYIYNAYYVLENDIDLQGEQLYIIGDGVNSFFAGNFNGNNHKISNFYITDTEVNQDDYTTEYRQYVGLFGYISPSTSSSTEIAVYGLTLENFEMILDGTSANVMFSAGAIAGIAMGATISNCSVSGKITAKATTTDYSYVGGLVGYFQSYSTDTTRYYALVQSCSSDVDITCTQGYVYSAGGIVGTLSTYEERTGAIILNSYSTGDVVGSIRSGGIAGTVTPYGAVKGCYATGYIEADNTFGNLPGYESYAYAYSGGIVGYLDYSGIVSDSFFTGEVYASSTSSSQSKSYAICGAIAAVKAEGGEDYIETVDALAINCYSTEDKVTIDDAFIKNTLGWGEEDWTFNGDGLPTVNLEAASKSFTVTISLMGGQTIDGNTELAIGITDSYVPMSYWFDVVADGISEFIDSDGGYRSYGYYFDEALTQPVPYSYIITGNETIYAGFADYKEVAGEYYFTGDSASAKLFILYADGTYTYRNGALNYTTYYTYDGETITLFYSPAFSVTEVAGYDESGNAYYALSYYCAKATVKDGLMTVIDMNSVSEYIDSANSDVYTADSPLKALKKSDLLYGEYYTASGATYVFNPNGTGVYKNNNSSTAFTFTVTESEITVVRGGSTFTGQISGNVIKSVGSDSLTQLDEFAGVWAHSAGSNEQYTMDGKGGWKYEYFIYGDDGGIINLSTASGSYTVNADRTITINNNGVQVRIGIDENGNLSVNDITYYRQYGYVGTWRFNNIVEPVEITFYGIGAEGYGTALVDYGAYGSYEVNYAAVDYSGVIVLELYENDFLLATLEYCANDNTLNGTIYSIYKTIYEGTATYRYEAKFALYDAFKGEWISDELETVVFDGFGYYDLKGTSAYLAIKSTVKINGEAAGSYTLVNGTLTGSFTYEGIEYNIRYDEANDIIVVTYEGGTFNLEGYDDWYGLELVSDDGTVYSFDGRGNLLTGGTVTATSADGKVVEYAYKTNGESVTLTGDSTGGSIKISGGNYALTLSGKTSNLKVYNLFTGAWLIGGGVGEYIVIGEIDATFTAKGTLFGDDVTFTYHRDGKYISFEYEGETLYINSITSDNQVGITIGYYNSVTNYVAIGISEHDVDEYIGTYKAADGSYLVMDGFSSARFASGTAILYDAGGNVKESYTYSVNKFGIVELMSSSRYYLLPTDDSEGAYALDGKYYEIKKPNGFYNVTATDEDDSSITYLFDGNVTMYCSDGSVYSYEINSYDSKIYVYYLTLTDADGNEYSAELDYTDSYLLSISDAAEDND